MYLQILDLDSLFIVSSNEAKFSATATESSLDKVVKCQEASAFTRLLGELTGLIHKEEGASRGGGKVGQDQLIVGSHLAGMLCFAEIREGESPGAV